MFSLSCSYVTDNGATDPNSAIGNAGAALLLPDIQDTRQMLTSMGVKLPVGTSDAGSYFNNMILQAVDYGVSNNCFFFDNPFAQRIFWFFSNIGGQQLKLTTCRWQTYILGLQTSQRQMLPPGRRIFSRQWI